MTKLKPGIKLKKGVVMKRPESDRFLKPKKTTPHQKFVKKYYA